MMILVTGGSGSGKSAFAEDQVVSFGEAERVYIATMFPFDEESKKRVQRHRNMRSGKGFETIECYTDLAQVRVSKGSTVLLECMSNLTANELYLDTGAKDRTREAVLEGIRELEKRCRGLVAVTNEVFCDLPPADEEMQEYLSVLGTINCRMAKMADQVTEVVYGIPVEVKKG